MSTAWIYAFADSGYDRGVKLGRSSTKLGAWHDAPCYSPRPLLYLAGWEVDLPVDSRMTKGAAANAIERKVGRHLGPPLTYPRNGREWFDIETAAALSRISDVLGAAPSIENGHLSGIVTNDQFLNPHPRKFGSHPFRIVAWIYREQLTGRVKTQLIDDWQTPFEIRRRYSRNGFEELAAFTSENPSIPDANRQTYEAWVAVMMRLGAGTAPTHYGWLPPEVDLQAVSDLYLKSGLASIGPDRHRMPAGVRPLYNRSAPEPAA